MNISRLIGAIVLSADLGTARGDLPSLTVGLLRLRFDAAEDFLQNHKFFLAAAAALLLFPLRIITSIIK